MFSNTFQRVQENADEIWKYQRHWLVYEYVTAPFLPPPLNGISYIFGILRHIILKFIKKNYDSTGLLFVKIDFYDLTIFIKFLLLDDGLEKMVFYDGKVIK